MDYSLEIEGLVAHKHKLEAEIERLRAGISDAVASGDLRLTSPCILCGYSGPGFYQPDQHKCSALDATNGPTGSD